MFLLITLISDQSLPPPIPKVRHFHLTKMLHMYFMSGIKKLAENGKENMA